MAARGTRLCRGRGGKKKGTACSLPPLEAAMAVSGQGSVAPGLNCGGAGTRVGSGVTLGSNGGTATQGSEEAGGAEAA
jgi:hypothetical protein